jgi:hypothetical protein
MKPPLDHRVSCLLHYLAAHPESPQMLINHPVLLEAMPAAISHGLARNPPEKTRVELDRYWLELTEKGRSLVIEQQTTLETLA